MPAYRVRSKRGTRRVTLTEAEEIELTVGPPSDRASLFASPGDRADAAALLAIASAGRSPTAALIAAGPILAELRRRHGPHWVGADDLTSPATFDGVRCARCNRAGWVPPWHHGAADARPALS